MADNASLDEQNSRLPLLDPASLNSEQKAVYDRIVEHEVPWAKQAGFQAITPGGNLLGPFNAFLYSDELGTAALRYLNVERDATCLSARVREVVILSVGAAFQSNYELYAHRAVAARAGLAPDDIETLASGQEPAPGSTLSADERAAQRFTLALARDHRASPEIFAQALASFGHKGLVDLLHLAGIYMTVSTLLNAFEVPVPA